MGRGLEDVNDIIEVIFPCQGISLVAGPTGAGKTRWLLETLLKWQLGEDVLGYRSYPRTWMYVSGDRSQHEAEDTIMDLGINPNLIPLFPAFGIMPPMGAMGVLDEAEKRHVELIVWEGFGTYVESNAGSTKVKSWLNLMTWRLTHELNGKERFAPLTIIGVMEQPKMKPRDIYANPRQRISGPAAWGHTAASVVLVEYEDTDCKGPYRVLGIYPHQKGAAMEFRATLETGHFVILNRVEDEDVTKVIEEVADATRESGKSRAC